MLKCFILLYYFKFKKKKCLKNIDIFILVDFEKFFIIEIVFYFVRIK